MLTRLVLALTLLKLSKGFWLDYPQRAFGLAVLLVILSGVSIAFKRQAWAEVH